MDASNANAPTALERIEALAFEREDAAAYRQWLRLVADARKLALRNRHVLLSVIAEAGRLSAQFDPLEFEAARRLVDDLQSLIDWVAADLAERGVEPTQEWFQALDRWAQAMLGQLQFDAADAAVQLALATGARRYPGLYQALRATQAELLARTGQVEAAAEIASWYVRRPYLLPERRRLPQIYARLLSVLLLGGRLREYRALLWRGFAEAYRDASLRDEFVARIGRTYRSALRALLAADASVASRCQLVLHQGYQRLHAAAPLRVLRADRLAYWFAAAVGYGLEERKIGRSQAGASGAGAKRDALLVTRAMGGIGDLLMMSPGLRALREANPGVPIHFAIPGQYFPLFEGNDDFVCIDIESAGLDPERYRAWFDLTDCPAARVESRQAPNVRIGRIELFARAMGLDAAAIRGARARPIYVVSPAERSRAGAAAAAIRQRGRPLVGVQLEAAETYRNYPHNVELQRLLAQRCTVLAFGTRVPADPAIDGVHPVQLSLREAFALAGQCDLLVGPDSSFLHLAAALDKPMVLIAGPVDGKLRAREYPTVKAIVPDRRQFPCAPCWRNESINCYLSGRRESVCLRSISPESVAAHVYARLPLPVANDATASAPEYEPTPLRFEEQDKPLVPFRGES